MANDIIDFTNPDEVGEFLLTEGIPGGIAFKSERRDDSLYIPEIDMVLTPVVHQLQDKSAGIAFYMRSDKYDKQLFEYSMGMGSDGRTAVGMALASFLFSFMEGFHKMTAKDEPTEIKTEFAGKTHEWNVYLSNVTGMGLKEKTEENASAYAYWDLLKDEIMKRLGNQRLALVKVYASKSPKDVICEVRIDDVPFPELGEMVRTIAEKWNVEQFISEKQFFFIEQKEETYIPSEYDGREGSEKLRTMVLDYLKMFRAASTQELYERLPYAAANSIGDAVIAAECYSFLPEMAAMHAWGDRMKISDMAIMGLPDGTEIKLSIYQLSDYMKLDSALGDIISKGDFGDETDNLWKELIGCSSIYSAVDKALEAGSKLEDLRISNMYYNMCEGFVIR